LAVSVIYVEMVMLHVFAVVAGDNSFASVDNEWRDSAGEAGWTETWQCCSALTAGVRHRTAVLQDAQVSSLFFLILLRV